MKSVVLKYWKIECTKHLTTIYQTKVSTKEMSEQKLIAFIRILLAKYALSDNEILKQHTRTYFAPKTESIAITRTQSDLDEPLNISFFVQVADVSICASLTN